MTDDLLKQMRVLHKEILNYFQRNCCIFNGCWLGGQYLLKCIDDVGEHKLILFIDLEHIIQILLAQQPSINSLNDGDFLLLEQPDTGFH